MIHKQPQPFTVPPQFPINDGLVLYMPFLEGSGRFTADLSGRDNHCNLNGVTWGAAKDKKGFALTFDGINDEGDFAKQIVPASGDFTIMCWLYCEGDTAGGEDYRGTCINVTTYISSVKGIGLGRNVNDLQLIWGNGTTSITRTLVPGIKGTNKRKWYHVTAVYIETTTTMYSYINGVLWASDVQEYMSPNRTLRIGYSWLNSSESYWYGQLKNIRVYSRAVPLDELRKIYEAEK